MSLSTNLTAAWELTEASGNATDSVGSETLTDNNTVTSATGLIYSTARLFTRANSESFSHVDDATLEMGDIDFSFEAWIYLNTAGTTRQRIISKEGSSTREYALCYRNSASNLFDWNVWSPAGAQTQVTASNFGAPSTATWYQIVCWHDSVNNQIGIAINNGTPNTAAFSAGVRVSTNEFDLGRANISGFFDYLDARLGPVRLWKNRVLSSSDITELYNSGAGRTYSYIAGGASGGPWPWFTDNELSGGLQHLGM